MMDASRIWQKLREAKFFLGHMSCTTSTVTQEPEHFAFFLSAFVSAARSVTFVMQESNKKLYDGLFPSGDFDLEAEDERLFRHMNDCRSEVVKRQGNANTLDRPDEIEVPGEYRDESGRFIMTGPPGSPPMTLKKSRYYWTHDRKDHDVLDDCGRYVALLEGIVDRFEHSREMDIDLEDG